jgi:hypothetical protein
MKDVLLTEISATQSAGVYFTALAQNTTPTIGPTLTPFQPAVNAQEPTTQEPISSATGIPLPTNTAIPAPQLQPTVPNTLDDDGLTFRYYELSIIL